MKEAMITMDDLIVAYRKAKVDAFYENGHVTSVDFAEYEFDLFSNLNTFLHKFNNDERDWFISDNFIGSHRYALKKVQFVEENVNRGMDTSFMYFSNSSRRWNKKQVKDIEYRIIGRHSIDFHILSSLWLEKVGYKFDNKISSNSYGCRIKGIKIDHKNPDEIIIDSKVNGHFKPYIHNYQSWQRNGLNSISNAIKENKKVIAFTTDITKFYHRISCEFLLNKEFLNLIGIQFTPLESKITKLLIESIDSWSNAVYNDETTPEKFKKNGHSGIPMGLGASKVIANVLLYQLDKQLEEEVRPIYYGRYVDDIFIVLEDIGNINCAENFWDYLVKRLLILTKIEITSSENEYEKDLINSWTLLINYSKDSLIEFSRNKEKFYFLEGKSGESFLNALKESLDENSSEWNLPPDINNDIDGFSKEVSKVTSDIQESANGLRKSDGLSLQRQKFILYLKRLEIVMKYFPEKKWQKQFDSFMNLCIEYTITPESLSIYTKYYPRVIALCVSVNKFEVAKEFIQQIKKAFNSLKNTSKRNELLIDNSKKLLFEQIGEAILCNYYAINEGLSDLNDILEELDLIEMYDKDLVNKLIVTDLHRIPFKEFILKPVKNINNILFGHTISNITKKRIDTFYDHLNHIDIFCKKILKEDKNNENVEINIPFAFLFYTRPFTLFELSYLITNWHDDEEIDHFINFCKLFNIDFNQQQKKCNLGINNENILNKNLRCICLNSSENNLNKTVAFTSLETKEDSWLAVIQEHGNEPDNNRVERIFRLVEDILRCKLYDNKQIHYVLFPELSIPRDLLSYISNLFLKKGISIIAGVEYQIKPNVDQNNLPHINNFVSNQLIYVLTVKGQYQNSHIIIRQEKEIPALQEEKDLYNMGGAILRAQSNNKYIINHDGFYFAGLICNEFLDIKYRAMLRGLIDALIVIEWNKDTKTYNALIEATANDLHAFIMQVNNRKYGDTRLRIPYKEDYKRDVVRVKGGELDYFVVATLPILELRKFQRHHRSPEEPFKPVPTGFKMSELRRKIDF